MGSLGDPHTDTQPPSLSGDNSENKNFDYFLQNTLPFMETAPFVDGIETQVMNFEDETQVMFENSLETQVMNFEETQLLFQDGLETQVMNFPGETQVLDDFDGFENMDIQLLDEWNNEEMDKIDGVESEKTDILCDTDELNDSVKIICCSPSDPETTNISKQDDNKALEKKSVALCDEHISRGVKIDFTTIRVEAIRASGLAARNKALNKSNNDLSSSKNKNDSPKENRTSGDSSTTGVKMDFTSIRIEAIRASGLAAHEKALNKSKNELNSLKSVNESPKENHNYKDNSANGIGDSFVFESDKSALEDEQMKGKKGEKNDGIGDSAVRRLFMNDDKFIENEGLDNNYQNENNELVGLSYVDSQEPGDLSQDNAVDVVEKLIKSSDTDFSKASDIVGTTYMKLKPVSSIKGTQNLARKRGLNSISCEKGIYDWDDNREDEGGGEIFRKIKKAFSDDDGKSSDSKSQNLKRNSKKTKVAEVKENLSKKLDEQSNADFLNGIKVTTAEKDLQNMVNVGPDPQMDDEAINNKSKILRKTYSLRKRSSSSSYQSLTRKSKQQKISCTNLIKENKDFEKSNIVSPSSGLEKDYSCAPIASRTRQHGRSIGGNLNFDTIIGMRNKKVTQSRLRKEKTCEISNKSNNNLQNFSVDEGNKRKTRSSSRVAIVFPSSDREFNRRKYLKLGVSPGERNKISTTPVSSTSSGFALSPICVGEDYVEKNKNLSRKYGLNETGCLISHGSESLFLMKEPMRDMANVRVLFSHHLDDDIIDNQKKILAKLGASVASSIKEATHFISDKFVRTRNLLEAIAFGKPIVTHLWLESCEQASSFIDEKSYILRDAKKEKEFDFNLPSSLIHSCQHPLLQGLRVWITPNTKPGLEILSSLVKAVHGMPVERIGRSVLKHDKIPDDLIVLSCEEDYAACLPYIEKGGAVFSSELLMNGIVTQKLEYERYRLFDEHIKKTRSTTWLKQCSNQYLRVAKCK